MRPRSKFPTDGSINWCLANAVVLRSCLYETCPPSTAPPFNPPNSVNVQGTKHLGRTHLRSSTLFPPDRLPLLLALCLLCQDRTYFCAFNKSVKHFLVSFERLLHVSQNYP
ncbi:hypothetical protein AMECASPLE_038778 [Ameca splendens]|uniref:Uncharacterized protein n=1 Tax=Ameca splendens TaxID=208324 RepID=A0ABV0Z7X7_9TELE